MVWGGMEACTALVRIGQVRLTAQRYIDILEEHVLPFAPFIGKNVMLMQDNDRPRIAGIVHQYRPDVGIPAIV